MNGLDPAASVAVAAVAQIVVERDGAGGGAPYCLASGLASGVARGTSVVAEEAPGAAAAGAEAAEDETCGVCLDAGTFVDVRRCGHRLCLDCAQELVRMHEFKLALCPFCRAPIRGFARR